MILYFHFVGIHVSFGGPILGVSHYLAKAQHLVSELEHCPLLEELGSSVKKRAAPLF